MEIRQLYTRVMHGKCIQAHVDQTNKLSRMHAIAINDLQTTIADLQSDVRRLNKEILFTQEGYERQIADLDKQVSMLEDEVRYSKKGKHR